MIFEKDWRAIIPSLCWSWILCFIPSIPKAIDIATTDYQYNDGMLIFRHGLLTKKTETIDLYRVRNISSEESVFSGGKLFIIYANGEQKELPYIKNANKLVVSVRDNINQQREAKGIKPLEILQ